MNIRAFCRNVAGCKRGCLGNRDPSGLCGSILQGSSCGSTPPPTILDPPVDPALKWLLIVVKMK